MENNEFQKVRIKNRTCYYFNDLIKLEDFNLYFDNILIDEKSYKNILIYDIVYKTLIDPKPLRSRLDKMDGFIRIYDGSKHLVLLGSEKYDAIHNRIICLIKLISGITVIFSYYYAQIKVDSHDSLPIKNNDFS